MGMFSHLLYLTSKVGALRRATLSGPWHELRVELVSFADRTPRSREMIGADASKEAGAILTGRFNVLWVIESYF